MSQRVSFNSCLSETQIHEFRRRGYFKPQEVRVIRQHISTCNICAFLHQQAGTSNFLSLFIENISRFLSSLKESFKKCFQHYSTKYLAIILICALIAPIVLFKIIKRSQTNAISLESAIPQKANSFSAAIDNTVVPEKVVIMQPVKQIMVSKVSKNTPHTEVQNPEAEIKVENKTTEPPLPDNPAKAEPTSQPSTTLPENLFQLNF